VALPPTDRTIAAELEADRVETLMVYLDGALRYLPLAALHDGQQWLAERYALAVYTAVKDDNLKDPRLPHWQVAGFGVSSGHTAVGPDRRNFAALPGVARELDGIIQDPPLHRTGFLPGRVYLDPDFTHDALNAALGNARYPVIHLATHFALGSGDDDSFLLLGDGSPLTLRDLRRQPFAGVELVALSACDTAVELTAYAGREVEGLGTVVQQKGAKGVIATLWPVADASTGRFMQELYRLRVDRGLSKAESLHQAQRAFLRGTGTDPAPAPAGPPAKPAASLAPGRDATPFPASAPPYTPDPARPYAHPYYWAPFILMGNWL
jgi:CHAT domain-containing protein